MASTMKPVRGKLGGLYDWVMSVCESVGSLVGVPVGHGPGFALRRTKFQISRGRTSLHPLLKREPTLQAGMKLGEMADVQVSYSLGEDWSVKYY